MPNETGHAAYMRRHRTEPTGTRPVITDLAALRQAPMADVGRARYAARHGNKDAQQALRDLDAERAAQKRAEREASEWDDATTAAIARMTLDDIEGRQTITPDADPA